MIPACVRYVLTTVLLPLLLAPAPFALAQSYSLALPPGAQLQASAQAAQDTGKPLLLMFSLPDCAYCRVVRRNYLAPLLRHPAADERPEIRELTMTSRQSITDFDGTVTTPAALAKRYGVAVAPTLVFVNALGEMLVDPLVGGEHAFYDAYLGRALAESRRKLITGPPAR